MRYISIPNSYKRLYIGSIVILERFPDTKWILKNGWYTYESKQYNGWYFCSLPEHTIIPVENEDLLNIIIIFVGEEIHNQYPLYDSCYPYHLLNAQKSSSSCISLAINFKEVFGTDEPTKSDTDTYLATLNPPISPHEGVSFINTDETSITYNTLYMYFRLPKTDELILQNNYTKTESTKFDTIQGIL